MKKYYFLLTIALFIFSNAIQAQIFTKSNKELSKIATVQDASGWINFHDDVSIDPQNVFTDYKSSFKLGANDGMSLYRKQTDNIGYTHYRYQQNYKGVPVSGAEFMIHSVNGKAITGNGKLVNGLNINTAPQITHDQAIEAAIGFVGAQKFMWEDPANDALLKQTTGKANATYYPKAELVIFDKKFTGNAANYRLAWKVDVYAQQPLSYQDIYVDAQTGAIFHLINRLMDTDVHGIAHTKYSGVQTIITDSLAPNSFRLREATTGHGIETYNMQTTTNYAGAIDFTDADNNWNNVNAQHDEVATDAHWGAEMTYDFYLNKFNRHSYDDSSSKLISYVHYDVGYVNAFWDGTRMTYGDGDGTTYGPLTAIDVCGHEITHGVTQYTAALIYQDEPGALNESVSDMMGTAIEFYARPGNADWYMGNDFDLTGGHGFRDMSNPKAMQQPNTYHGQYWYTGTIDNGGVHTNSGVSNYWFYLVSKGGTGTNDLSHYYAVSALGIDTAEQIVYRALTHYMTMNTQFIDMREATLHAAADLFGSCSNAYVQVANAWYAVGVGMAIADNDFSMYKVTSPVTDCGLTKALVSVRAIYNGCNIPVPAGDTVRFFYHMDGGAVVEDTLFLLSSVNGGDTISFSFDSLADVSTIGTHHLNVWLRYSHDTLVYNDTLLNYTFVNKVYQNVDVGVTGIIRPVSSCNLSASEPVTVQVKFFGCDFLSAGNKIPMVYTVNNGAPVHDTLLVSGNFGPDTVINFTFAQHLDFSASGTNTIDAWTAYPPDTYTTNDAFHNYKVKKPLVLSDTVVTFEESNVNDFFLVRTTAFSHANVSLAAHHTGNKGFQMTGGNALQYYTMLQFPTGNDTWNINQFLSAKIDFCLNASAWSTAYMHFDLKQTYGDSAYRLILGPGTYNVASSLRVLVNDSIMIGGTYRATTSRKDPFVTQFADLSAYAGTYFMLTFETRNICKDTLGFTMDNAYLDNITFSPEDQHGIKENNKPGALAAYPNPSDGRFWIDYPALKSGDVKVEVFDFIGRQLLNSSHDVISGYNHILIDMGHQPAGVYMIRITNGEEIRTGKMIISNR